LEETDFLLQDKPVCMCALILLGMKVDNINIVLREVICEIINWMELSQDLAK
jgi:hypothetical protein